MMSRTLTTIALCLVVLSCVTCPSYGKSRKLKLCKVDYFWECFAEPLMKFTGQANGTGIPMTNEDYEQFCFNNHDFFPYCARQWLKRCGNDIHLDLVTKGFLMTMQQSMNVFCDPKGHIRPTYLKHAQCMVEQVKISHHYRKTCIREFQANHEWVHDAGRRSSLSSMVRGVCCAYNDWEQCIVGQITERCGTEAGKTFPYLIEHLSMDYFKTICPKTVYNPNDEQKCPSAEFKAPEDYMPKGLKSNSIFSHFFSYMCPNVGWGVDGSRDF